MARIDNTNPFIPIQDGSVNCTNSETATVRLGESTLADVAQRLGMDAQSLQTANPGLCNGEGLKAGQELCLPKLPRELPARLEHECMPHEENCFPPRPMGDPLARGAILALLEKLGFGNWSKPPIDADKISFGCGDKPPIDADRISFGHGHRHPIDADRISFGGGQPIDADKISFRHHHKHPIDADKISFGGRLPIDADRISFEHRRMQPLDADKISFGGQLPIDADKISFDKGNK